MDRRSPSGFGKPYKWRKKLSWLRYFRKMTDITVTVQDARWDTERLSGLAYDVDSSFAGVLFFYTSSGTRYPMEVGGAVIPTFLPV
jgi:Monooxygenase subunit B protein